MSRKVWGLVKRIGDLFVLANSQFVGQVVQVVLNLLESCFKYLKDLG